jgi:hypothetical protein
MRYWEFQRDPREDERELAKKLRPAKPRPTREINPNTTHEIRVDGNGQRSKHITLRSLNTHRQWRDARAIEMAKDNEFLPSMYADEQTTGRVMDDKKREWEAARRELKVLAAEIENAIEAAKIGHDKKEEITRLAKMEIENRLRKN